MVHGFHSYAKQPEENQTVVNSFALALAQFWALWLYGDRFI